MKQAVPNPSQRRVTRSRSRKVESTSRSNDVGAAGARSRWGQNKGRTSKLSGSLASKQGVVNILVYPTAFLSILCIEIMQNSKLDSII